jgi:hypothetical protein
MYFHAPWGELYERLWKINNFSNEIAKKRRGYWEKTSSINSNMRETNIIANTASLLSCRSNLQRRWRRDTGAALSLLLSLIRFPFSILYRVASIHESIYALHADLKFAWTPITLTYPLLKNTCTAFFASTALGRNTRKHLSVNTLTQACCRLRGCFIIFKINQTVHL